VRIGCDNVRDAAELLRAVRSWLTDPAVVVQDVPAGDARAILDQVGTALDRVREVNRREG
jgi:hypothetical protein